MKAVQLLETEGTSTNLDARALLGLAHAFGIGVAQDNDKAMSHFRYAAARGYAASMPELARRLMKSDPGEAYYWYRLARQRLTPDLVGAKTQMLDWNIQRLKEALPPRFCPQRTNWWRNSYRSSRRSGARRSKSLRRPGIQAAVNRRLTTAAFWRDVQPDDIGVGEQAREIRRFEKQFWFGMHRVK